MSWLLFGFKVHARQGCGQDKRKNRGGLGPKNLLLKRMGEVEKGHTILDLSPWAATEFLSPSHLKGLLCIMVMCLNPFQEIYASCHVQSFIDFQRL